MKIVKSRSDSCSIDLVACCSTTVTNTPTETVDITNFASCGALYNRIYPTHFKTGIHNAPIRHGWMNGFKDSRKNGTISSRRSWKKRQIPPKALNHQHQHHHHIELLVVSGISTVLNVTFDSTNTVPRGSNNWSYE